MTFTTDIVRSRQDVFNMPTVLSRMAMQLKKTAWIIPVFMVSGCSLSPAIPVIGAYYPSWFFCAIASLILMLITRRVIQRANINLAFVGIIYTALFALYAMLFWLAFF
ncbi:hypothetical protein SSJG_02616 [Escherichia coli D9]|nr:hypothetical protein SSJG_02616 [Escherichia coli D9]